MMTSGPRLGVEFGATRTVATLAVADGRTVPLLVEGPVAADGEQQVLARAAAEAYRAAGGPPAGVVLAHPAGWPVHQVERLRAAARAVGLGEPAVVVAPVAAAAYLTDIVGCEVAWGRSVVVCELGTNGVEVSAVRRTPAGWQVVATAVGPAAELAGGALRESGVPPAAVAGVLLLGAPDRIAAATGPLHQALGVLPTVVDRPDQVVVEGALRIVAAAPAPPGWLPPPAGPPPTGRTNAMVWAVAAGLAAVAVVTAVLMVVLKKDGEPQAGGGATVNPTGPAAETGPAATVDCTWIPVDSGGNPAVKDVGTPPQRVPTTGLRTMTIVTSRGEITVELAQAAAPCTVASLAHLAGRRFYDNSRCHRLVTGLVPVLQCGDPSGTGTGGPTYRYAEENLPNTRPLYPKGVVAMAKAADPATTGSQFFFVYNDIDRNDPALGTQGLDPDYTVAGTVTRGLDIIERVAAAGVTGGEADGPPKQAITIVSVTVN